jgi:FAD/FMN-containing dehydrogenase
MEITRLDGNRAQVDDETVQAFRSAMRGPVRAPGEQDYEAIRVLHNRMIDRRPALIARCAGASDVITCVNFARAHQLLVAVRGGGHGVAGNALCDGGFVIDLSLMRAVRVDPHARIAWVQGGAALGDVDHETQAFGLVAPAGVVSTTGVAGLTLGGGYGWVRGKYGMSIDNLRSVDIVTADGEFRHADDTENPDLFWAVRGGGGNFGVVTTFEFRLHPHGPLVFLCLPLYPLERAHEVLRAWHAFMQSAPDEFTTEFFCWTVPAHPNFPAPCHGRHVVIPAGVYVGPVEEAERFVQPLRRIGRPLIDLSGARPYTAIQSMFDPYLPKGELLNYWKALYLDAFNDELIHALITVFRERPAVRCPFVLHDLRGASRRVPEDATALGGRDARYLLELNSSWEDPAESERNIAWTRRTWSEMAERFSARGGYLNMTCYNEEGEPLVKATYGAKFERLRRIKKKYDPLNLFRLNANIPPAA